MSEYIFLIVYLILSFFYSYHLIASLQLNNYKISKIIDKNNKKLLRFLIYNFIISIVYFVINLLFYNYKINYIYVSNIAYLLCFIIILLKNKSNFSKTPLKFTNRIIRLYISIFIINTIIYTLFLFYIKNYFNVLLPFFIILNFVNVIVTYFIILPFEKLNNCRYIYKAKKIFNNKDIIKIAITGSYGKTSVKTILGNILSYKYNTKFSIKNYNTELGLALTSKLIDSKTEVFIAEFGARKNKDILRLSKIFNQDIAIITGICNQHLETFKNIENIIHTKSEILINNPDLFCNGNNEYVKQIYDNYNGCKEITYSKNCYVENISYTCKGTYFTLVINETKNDCFTKLLGKSAIENILLSSLVAYKIGMSLSEIKNAINNLPYIEHRLSIIEGRFTIIDDSYNSNEIGVNEALEVLNLFDTKKYCFVSGLVELGDKEDSINYNLGINLSKICDKIIIVRTKQSNYIEKGILSTDFNKDNILIYNSTNDAIRDFDNVIEDKSTLLIMSDLPSNYTV